MEERLVPVVIFASVKVNDEPGSSREEISEDEGCGFSKVADKVGVSASLAFSFSTAGSEVANTSDFVPVSLDSSRVCDDAIHFVESRERKVDRQTLDSSSKVY